MKKLFILIAFLSLDSFAAGSWSRLSGSFALENGSLVDPVSSKSQVAYFFIQGKAAEKIFWALDVEMRPDLCNPDEKKVFVRSVGDMVCRKYGKRYTCDFGVDLETGESGPGRPC